MIASFYIIPRQTTGQINKDFSSLHLIYNVRVTYAQKTLKNPKLKNPKLKKL